MSKVDLTGQRFGRVVVIGPTTERRHGKTVWECQCDCGNTAMIITDHLKKRHVRSCGCLGEETRNKNLIKAHAHIKNEDSKEGTRISMLDAKRFDSNTSGHKGVSRSKQTGKWEAYIHFQKKKKYLGSFDNLEDAVKARKKAEDKLFKPLLDKKISLPQSE